MQNEFSRTETLIGKDALEKLKTNRIAIFGIGGVGGYVVEALARSGVGELDLIDNDTVSITNINRQIIALQSTIGRDKVEVARQRVLDINPKCKVNIYKTFFTPDTTNEFDFSKFDYVVDAIDSDTGKIEHIMKCNENNIPIISAMGAGNKLHPEQFEISDIYKTSVCPLAKVMRQELKKRRIKKLKVVYSKELQIKQQGQRIPASISFTPSAVGLIMAGEVVRDLINQPANI